MNLVSRKRYTIILKLIEENLYITHIMATTSAVEQSSRSLVNEFSGAIEENMLLAEQHDLVDEVKHKFAKKVQKQEIHGKRKSKVEEIEKMDQFDKLLLIGTVLRDIGIHANNVGIDKIAEEKNLTPREKQWLDILLQLSDDLRQIGFARKTYEQRMLAHALWSIRYGS